MARMRAHARELSAKDAVWQHHLLAGARQNQIVATAAVTPATVATVQPPLVPIPPPLNTAAAVPVAAQAAALSPTPHSPNMCASPVSPGEMTATPVPPLPLPIRNDGANGGAINKPVIARPKRGSGKIRRKRLTKEEEARFPVEELADLTGTTAARSRKMSRKEHDLMLHKRRLRNRESAARSREKQRRTTTELAAEIDVLNERANQLADACKRAANAARHHAARADALARTNAALAAELAALRSRKPPLATSEAQPNISAPLPPHSIAGSLPLSSVSSATLVNATAGLPSTSLGVLTVPQPPQQVPPASAAPTQAPGFSSDTLDRLLADAPLPPISRAPSLHRMGSWSSIRPEQAASTLRKQNSLLFMEFDGNAPSLSQDMAALLPASAAPL